MQWSSRRCWTKLVGSHRAMLVSAQHPKVYWSGREKARDGGCCHDMTSSEAAVLTAWSKTDSWWVTSPLYTHIRSRFSRSFSLLRSPKVQTPRFQVLQWGESAAAERGGANRDHRALQAQSYLYSVYRFSLTHHGAGRSIKNAAAYHWKETICSYFVSVILTDKKQINHLHITAGCETDTLLFEYWLTHCFNFFINPSFFFRRLQIANHISSRLL